MSTYLPNPTLVLEPGDTPHRVMVYLEWIHPAPCPAFLPYSRGEPGAPRMVRAVAAGLVGAAPERRPLAHARAAALAALLRAARKGGYPRACWGLPGTAPTRAERRAEAQQARAEAQQAREERRAEAQQAREERRARAERVHARLAELRGHSALTANGPSHRANGASQ